MDFWQSFLGAVAALFVFGVLSLLAGRRFRLASLLGVAGPVVALGLAGGPIIQVLLGGGELTFSRRWDVPLGSFSLGIDPLSAWFLLPILVLSALAAIYGWKYLQPYRLEKNIGTSWMFYNLLVLSMLLVVTARNGVLFLVAWEIMSLASFCLVMFDDQKASVRRAGWTYLAATHIGTAFLFMMFFLLSRQGQSMDFEHFADLVGKPGLATIVFLMAVIGFGTKAGFMPLHVWLPEAHPAAPSHVSALMSGVMIKTGIYGLLRMLTLLPPAPAWWGWTLLGIGALSGVLGVLYALAQHDIKRLLAYSSVENIGIITMGLGIGLLGAAWHTPLVAALGFAGALLHVMNHAMFKGLLFLGAGTVIQQTHSGQMDIMGGLLKKMPAVGVTFLIGSAAISALPPLNGFLSEFLIYLGAFNNATDATGAGFFAKSISGVILIAALALIGGLALACFAKAFGIVFLGEPRSPQALAAKRPHLAMLAPMIALAIGCLAVGLAGPLIVPLAARPVASLCGMQPSHTFDLLGQTVAPLRAIVIVSAVLIGAAIVLAGLRAVLLRRRSVASAGTWDCGYAAPTARVQYTASSFSQPITHLFRTMLGLRENLSDKKASRGLFPSEGRFETQCDDMFLNRLFGPCFAIVEFVASKLCWLQHGRIQWYVLYIALTLLVLMVWKLA